MHKVYIGLLSIAFTTAFAAENLSFKEFDNEYNTGIGVYNSSFKNGAGYQNIQQSQFLSLEVERLFDKGIWMDVGASIVTSQNSYGNSANGTGQSGSGVPYFPGMPSSQDPNLGGVNAKVGYAFPVMPDQLQLTPYGLLGRNTNLAMSTILSNGFANVTNDYYYTVGAGGRLEYIVNSNIFLYADQLISYNFDQSQPVGGIAPQNNMVYLTTLGAKFNIVDNLQLGVSGFYKNYQAMASVPPPTPSNNGGTDQNGRLVSIYQIQYNVGMLLTVGLTY